VTDDSTVETCRRRIKAFRTSQGLSQAELGRQVGLGQSRIAAIEATGSVTIAQAAAFAEVFNVPIDMLIYEHPSAVTDPPQLQRLRQLLIDLDKLRNDIRKTVNMLGRPAHPAGRR